jgi:hypothetical protein
LARVDLVDGSFPSIGRSETQLVHRFVPAGSYVVWAKLGVESFVDTEIECHLRGGQSLLDVQRAATDGSNVQVVTVALLGAVSFSEGGTVEVACFSYGSDTGSVWAREQAISAVKVGAIH